MGFRLLTFFILLFLGSCSAQTALDHCKESLKNARYKLNTFYKSNDGDLLKSAVQDAGYSMLCIETRIPAIEIKISLLVLLENFSTGYEFVDSLTENDFAKPYKKIMNSNFFRAMESEANGDTTRGNFFYRVAIKSVEQYLTTTDKKSQIDKDAYYDLFFLKSRLLSKNEVNNELGLLSKKYPSEKEFFLTLALSFDSQD